MSVTTRRVGIPGSPESPRRSVKILIDLYLFIFFHRKVVVCLYF